MSTVAAELFSFAMMSFDQSINCQITMNFLQHRESKSWNST